MIEVLKIRMIKEIILTIIGSLVYHLFFRIAYDRKAIDKNMQISPLML